MTTSNTSESLSAEQVCAIIESCKKSNVTTFEWGGVKLSFGEQKTVAPTPEYAPLDKDLPELDPQLRAEMDEEAKLDVMLAEDPAAFEDYIERRETEMAEQARVPS